MVFPAKLEKLEEMFAFIREAASRQGFDGKSADNVRLACEEALVNVIRYAYAGKDGELRIECVNDPGELKVVISDSGIAFDPLSRPEPDINAPLEERSIGGLGIFMMKKLMDSVAYRREGGRNILTLVKRNPQGGGDAG